MKNKQGNLNDYNEIGRWFTLWQCYNSMFSAVFGMKNIKIAYIASKVAVFWRKFSCARIPLGHLIFSVKNSVTLLTLSHDFYSKNTNNRQIDFTE